MTDFEVTFDDAKAFADRMRGAEGVVKSEMLSATDRLTLAGERFAKQNLTSNGSVVTGNLRRGVTATAAFWAGGQVTGKYGTAVPYAKYVEKGRGPIVAGPGRVLRFKPKGSSGYIYRKRVGPAKAKPFIGPSVRQLRPLVQREYNAAVKRIIARAGGA